MTLLSLLAALVTGALLAWLLVNARYAARLAQSRAETALLRERVLDLQGARDGDSQTAQLIGPLHESLVRVERQVHALERDRGSQFSAVATELSRVQSSADGLREQTASLVGSLSSSSVRGAWGEVQLRRVLEHAGLLERCDFDTQVSARTDEGSTVRPDVVVHLPGGKHVVVDAKAPMSEFLAAQAQGVTAVERDQRLRAHARALRGHVDTLAERGYWGAVDGTPEMVVCFVPSEAVLGAALAADPELHEHAMRRAVVLASPATLLALLRTVAFTWRQEALTEGARELLELGRQLYQRIGALGRHTERLGTSLRRSVQSYNALVGSLEGRVLVTSRRMHELGLATDAVAAPEPLSVAPRPLTAVELVEAIDAEVARPELPELHQEGEAPSRQPPGSPSGGTGRAAPGIEADLAG